MLDLSTEYLGLRFVDARSAVVDHLWAAAR
jgi:hypothetical protein